METIIMMERRTGSNLFPGGLTAICLTLAAFLFCGVLAAEKPIVVKELKSDKNLSAIASISSTFMAEQHYEKKPLDLKMGEVIFDNYLKTLDPAKMYFIQSDVQQLSSRYRSSLHKMLPAGDLSFAFDSFNLLVKRMNEFYLFALKRLNDGFDFKGTDEFVFDRSKTQWPANEADLRDIWEKRIKNDLLNMKLMELSAEEEKKSESAEKKPSPDAKSEQPIVSHDSWKIKSPEERLRRRLTQIMQNYTGMEAMDVLELFLSSVLQTYDPHSSYMSPRTEQSFATSMNLSLFGIGAVLTVEDGYTKVTEIVAGGPADKDGHLKPEDRIIAVAQESGDPVDVIDMPLDKVVDMIRGPVDTKVTLTILDGAKGLNSIPKQITITRNKIILKEAEAKGEIREWKDPNGKVRKIAVISLPSFYMDFDAARRGDPDFKSSTRDVLNLVTQFRKDGIDGLVMDLRSNGGGSLWEAIALTGLFITTGPVVQVKDKLNVAVKNDDDDLLAYDGPLVVMINRLSASASEIFAAAIKDYKRGVIVGDTKTHGKGTVQTLTELSRYMPFFIGKSFPAGSIKLTNAKFYRINGESTQLKGVEPDIVFPSFTDTMEIGEEKLDFALPWDHIKAAAYQPVNPSLDQMLPHLKENSAKRISESKSFSLLKKDIESFNLLRKKKSVSLNLDTRWHEYLKEKKIQEEQDKLMRLDEKLAKPSKKNSTRFGDLYMEEALNIMNDLISESASEQNQKEEKNHNSLAVNSTTEAKSGNQ